MSEPETRPCPVCARPVGLDEESHISDDMASRAWDAYCEARDDGEDEPVVVMRAAIHAALGV